MAWVPELASFGNGAHPETTLEQMKKLAAALRLPACTPTYLSSIISSSSSWIRHHNIISVDDLLVACVHRVPKTSHIFSVGATL